MRTTQLGRQAEPASVTAGQVMRAIVQDQYGSAPEDARLLDQGHASPP